MIYFFILILYNPKSVIYVFIAISSEWVSEKEVNIEEEEKCMGFK